MRTRREIHLLIVLGAVSWLAGVFAGIFGVDTAILAFFLSMWASKTVDFWRERNKRIESELRTDETIAAGKELMVYGEDCECPACVTVRTRRKERMPS